MNKKWQVNFCEYAALHIIYPVVRDMIESRIIPSFMAVIANKNEANEIEQYKQCGQQCLINHL